MPGARGATAGGLTERTRAANRQRSGGRGLDEQFAQHGKIRHAYAQPAAGHQHALEFAQRPRQLVYVTEVLQYARGVYLQNAVDAEIA